MPHVDKYNYQEFICDSREDSKVSHYIINKMSQGDQARYRIGDQMFNDLPALLNFYKVINMSNVSKNVSYWTY